MTESTLRLGPFTADVRQGSALVGDTRWTVEIHWLGQFGTGFATYEDAAAYAYRAMEAAYVAAGEAAAAERVVP